jgi:hypothetical protein
MTAARNERKEGERVKKGQEETHCQNRRGDGNGTYRSRSGRGSRRSGRPSSGSLLPGKRRSVESSRENSQSVVRKRREGRTRTALLNIPSVLHIDGSDGGSGKGRRGGGSSAFGDSEGVLDAVLSSGDGSEGDGGESEDGEEVEEFHCGWSVLSWRRGRRGKMSEEKEEEERRRTRFCSPETLMVRGARRAELES